jgi:cytosine deaminase
MIVQHSLVIRNARLRGSEDTVDIAIDGERITSVAKTVGRGQQEIDAKGGLVTESFVDPHLHLCKTRTFRQIGSDALGHYQEGGMGKAMTAIEMAAAIKARYAESWIYENARKTVLEGLKFGVTHLQAFVDVDTKAKLEAFRAVLRLREDLKHVVHLKIVAFPQDGLLRDPGAEEYVRQAVQAGADVVGGIPWIEYTEEEMQEHVASMFRLAREQDLPVAMLVDDAGDGGLRTTETLIKATLGLGWIGRVTACHARAMALYPEPYFRKLAALARRADIRFVVDPHTGPLYARAFDLLAEGVTVALGQDDVADAYYPYGRQNMLEVAFLASHLMWVMSPERVEQLYDMVTGLAARAMGIDGHRLEPGAPANLVVLSAAEVYEALAYHEPPRYVVVRGEIRVENTSQTALRI